MSKVTDALTGRSQMLPQEDAKGRVDTGVIPVKVDRQMMEQIMEQMRHFYLLEGTVEDTGVIRKFATGATRDTSQGKLMYEGFLSPLVLHRFAEYMHKHRLQSDGSLRDPDNWQKGIPADAYKDSLIRHVFDAWRLWRDPFFPEQEQDREKLLELLMAILFNVQGLAHEILVERADL